MQHLEADQVYQLWRQNRDLQLRIKPVLQKYALSYEEFLVLSVLIFGAHRAVPWQKQFRLYLNMDKMTISNIVRRLESKKLLFRLKGTIDGRANTVRITGKGFKVCTEASQKVNEVGNAHFKERQADVNRCKTI
jgi:DNA-binding MarR family transcriptional regulator